MAELEAEAEEIRAEAEQLRNAHPLPSSTVVSESQQGNERFAALLQQVGQAIGASNPQQALAFAIDALALADSPDFRRTAITYRANAGSSPHRIGGPLAALATRTAHGSSRISSRAEAD